MMIYHVGGNAITPVKIEYSQVKDFKNLLVIKKM